MQNEEDNKIYKCLSEFRKPMIKEIISTLNIPAGSRGLDAGCGTGEVTRMLASVIGGGGHITGLDFSPKFIDYAQKNNAGGGIDYIVGDINSLPFSDSSFDWVWSMDTVWTGPREYGCPTEDPMSIVKEYRRVLKPGGSVFLLFWTSQKLLPGYPLLEARLNTTVSASAPFVHGMEPVQHVMNAGHWLQKAGFSNILARTFAGSITAPLSKNDKEALRFLFDMLWHDMEQQISEPDLELYKRLTDSNSKDYIPENQYYTGLYTYSLFRGRK